MTTTVDDDVSLLRRLGLVGRPMTVGKFQATNEHHLRALLSRLDAAKDKESADTIVQLLWNLENTESWLQAERERSMSDPAPAA